jgi:hypothetical protein
LLDQDWSELWDTLPEAPDLVPQKGNPKLSGPSKLRQTGGPVMSEKEWDELVDLASRADPRQQLTIRAATLLAIGAERDRYRELERSVRSMVEDGHPTQSDWFDIMCRSLAALTEPEDQ